MQVKHLKAKVRDQQGVAVVDLDGEINAFSEQELNARRISRGEMARTRWRFRTIR